MTHADIIHSFYQAFSKGDSEKMVSFYHDDVIFEDPAFGQLHGETVKNMWRMLILRSKGDLKINYENVKSSNGTGSAQWEATYHFGPNKKRIVNRIKAEFVFKDNKIIRHVDSFNLWNWCIQAFGWKGMLLGWTPLMKNKIQQQSQKMLKSYSEKNIS